MNSAAVETLSDLDLDLLAMSKEIGFAIHHKNCAEETADPHEERAHFENILQQLESIIALCQGQQTAIANYIADFLP